MTTLSTLLDSLQVKLQNVAGNTEATQEALIEGVVSLTNFSTQHGKETDNEKYPKYQPYWSMLYVALREAGFELLGSGYFSIAVSHASLPERVLKVGLKKEDSAAAYTAWCRMNKGKAGVPTIHATKRSTGCYVVVLDELFPLDTNKLNEWRGFRAAAAGVHNREWTNEAREAALDALYKTGQDIREFFRDLATFDLHEDNVMVDKHGNVVITDPVSYTNGVTSGTSWCLLDNSNELDAMKREGLAKRARDRHERNQKRQEIRKAQKARLKVRKAQAKAWKAREAIQQVKMVNTECAPGLSLPVDFAAHERLIQDLFVAPFFPRPNAEEANEMRDRLVKGIAEARLDNPLNWKAPPRMRVWGKDPLDDLLPALKENLLKCHPGIDPDVLKRINGLDDELQAGLMG